MIDLSAMVGPIVYNTIWLIAFWLYRRHLLGQYGPDDWWEKFKPGKWWKP
jgi:hypothetical protein